VLRIFLHKPPQCCGGVFSSFYGVGGAGIFLFFSLFQMGSFLGCVGIEAFSQTQFPRSRRNITQGFFFKNSLITPAKSAVRGILSLRSGDLRKRPQTELRLPHSNGCSTMTYPVGQARSQPSNAMHWDNEYIVSLWLIL